MEQKYEYKVTKAKHSHYEHESNFQELLDAYAKVGWKLKSTISDGDMQETIFIFERYHPEYKAYNEEVVNFITEGK